jgi:hypothetical protein
VAEQAETHHRLQAAPIPFCRHLIAGARLAACERGFADATILIHTPVLMSVIKQAGIDPVYFGALFIINNSGVLPYILAEFAIMLLMVLVAPLVTVPSKCSAADCGGGSEGPAERSKKKKPALGGRSLAPCQMGGEGGAGAANMPTSC